jgi:hypothetical protein
MGAATGCCPACERFIGPLDTCPYCDCPSERQAGLRILRLLAVLLTVCGLALLAVASRRHVTPSVEIGSIQPSMNFARVRVTGELAVPPRSGTARSGEPWFGFTLDDGTGRIRVTGFGETATGLAAVFSKIGTTGTVVNAEGWLSVRAGREVSLQVRNPAHVDVVREKP